MSASHCVRRFLQRFTADPGSPHTEAHTHGTSVEDVHFHEVGAIDSIIDTVGFVLALHLLGVDKVRARFIGTPRLFLA